MSVNLCPLAPQQYFSHIMLNLKAKRQKGQSTTDHIKDDLLTLVLLVMTGSSVKRFYMLARYCNVQTVNLSNGLILRFAAKAHKCFG